MNDSPGEIDGDVRLAKALSHPLRQRLLAAYHEGERSPAELAREVGASVVSVSYHTRRLEELGLIELVGTVRRRGGLQHRYRAVGRPVISDQQWEQLPAEHRRAIVSTSLADIRHAGEAALREGGFDRPDVHVSRTPLRLDERAWIELARAVAEVHVLALELDAACAARGASMRAELAMLCFERRDPPGKRAAPPGSP